MYFGCYIDGEFQCSFKNRQEAEEWCDCQDQQNHDVRFESVSEPDDEDTDGMNGMREDDEGNLCYDEE